MPNWQHVFSGCIFNLDCPEGDYKESHIRGLEWNGKRVGTMVEIKPRFEFRTWAKNFGMVEEKIRKLSPCEMIREGAETYIVVDGNDENNTKIRDKLMDIKVFVTKKEGLEQWNPRMKGEFPMKAST